MARDKYEQEVIDRIRKFRKAKGMTQEELARRCNLTTSYIGGIETYKKFPKIRILKDIANGLDVDIAYLLSPEGAESALIVSEMIEHLDAHIKEFLYSYFKPREQDHSDEIEKEKPDSLDQ